LAAAALYWAVHSLSAAGRRPEPGPPGLSGWLVYWLPEPSLEAAGAFEGALEEVSVFAYHFDERGRLTPATPWVTDTLGRLMASPRRGRVLVTVVNDVFASDGSTRMKDARCVHEAVATAESRARHIDQLMAVAALADGLEIDYENLAAEDRGPFTQLIAELAARLHAQDRRLAVVVQARLNDRAGAGAGAFDWRAIGQHADSVRLMAYYYHHGRGRPGPSAPPLWVANLHRFASSQ